MAAHPPKMFRLAAVGAMVVVLVIGRQLFISSSSDRPSSLANTAEEATIAPNQAATAPASAAAVATTAPAPEIDPTTIAWINTWFPDSRILERKEERPNAAGAYRREILLETHFKYPRVEIDERVERDAATGREIVRTREAMAEDHFLLKPQPGASAPMIEAAVEKAGGRVDWSILAESGVATVQISRQELGGVEAAISALSPLKGAIAYAEPDYLYFKQAVPNDPDYPQQTGLNNAAYPGDDIDAAAGWNLQTSAANVLVAVIDSGVRYTHQDIQANMWTNPNEGNDGWVGDEYGVNFYANTGDPNDDNGHGTHVAGILGACGNNDIGIAGVAWQVKIMALKFLDSSGVGASSDAVLAINFATSKKVQLMNNSWGGYSFSQTLHDAIANAGNAGILFVAAAGNDSQNTDLYPNYPSCYDPSNVIAVGNLTSTGAGFGSDRRNFDRIRPHFPPSDFTGNGQRE